jgi:hypothetical protein
MSKPRVRFLATIAVAALLIAGVPAEIGLHAEERQVQLPLTIERVWFKPSKKLISSGGDLTISEEGLELVTKKKTVLIALDDLYVLSYGRFKSDVDTEWSVLGIGQRGPAELLAIRDGKKLGYGQRTQRIYDKLKAALQQLAAAQYDVPPGYVTYEAFAKQFTLAIPANWDTHSESLVVEGDGRAWGTAIFSAEEIEYAHRPMGQIVHIEDDPVLRRVFAGEVPAFFVARRQAESGMDCTGFSEKARRRLVEREQQRTVDVLGYALEAPFSLSPATVGLCSGLRAQGRSRRPDGQAILIDLYLVAHERTEYVFGIRALEETYAAARQPFDTALATLKFSVAK